MFKKVLYLMLIVLYALPAFAARIVASVDDEIITDQDITDKIAIMEKMQDRPMEKNLKTRGKVLDMLIDEKVKIITATKAGASLSDDELDQHIAFLETQNNMPAGGFKKYAQQNNLSYDGLTNQLKADLMWLRYIQQKDLKRPQVTDKEVDEELNKIKSEMMRPMYLLAEIYIPFEDNEVAAEQEAEMLFNRIMDGESFTDLAKQYSKGQTAELMGDLGWVKAGQMEKPIDQVLPNIQTGQLSRPIKGRDGYHIILMRENQPALDSDMQQFVQVSQLVLPQEDYETQKDDIQKAAQSCMSFTQYATEHGVKGSHSGALPEMMLSRMPNELKKMIDGKKTEELSEPVMMPPYVLLAMKCTEKTQSILPAKEDIKRNLEVLKMEQMAEQMVKEARKALLVDIK